ncbi:diadenylate cyclase [Vibrio cincinnatiensis]|uniref:diadenylate cyclase n=1 Tax=Vibrio cincinnatiensis TaxID=675 RepID=UPI001EDE551D|nr:diadenylate cyclase [Vibrio cincinnatiensis]MCG3729302.1 hypothetical protein [Vibrio cincinnatiensis]HDZ3763822.1 DNA integrity scanning protein DisA nucleotide-binding domain protein [Vibrio cholerae]
MCSSNLFEQLVKTLQRVKQRATSDFSGVGIVVYNNSKNIPIFPLRASKFKTNPNNLVDDLLKISSYHSEYHDGFHFISENFVLTHTSQYFSPPIVSDAEVDYSHQFGGRFMAAMFGSYLQDILLIGILTKDNGITIFNNGKIIYSEHWNKK